MKEQAFPKHPVRILAQAWIVPVLSEGYALLRQLTRLQDPCSIDR